MTLIQAKQINLAGSNGPQLATGNLDMAGSVTAVDGDQATATAVAADNFNSGTMWLYVNGARYDIGNGVKTKAAYISGDGGATARAFSAIVATDTIRWNQSIAGFNIAATDKLDLVGLVKVP